MREQLSAPLLQLGNCSTLSKIIKSLRPGNSVAIFTKNKPLKKHIFGGNRYFPFIISFLIRIHLIVIAQVNSMLCFIPEGKYRFQF